MIINTSDYEQLVRERDDLRRQLKMLVEERDGGVRATDMLFDARAA